jgi:hypothetical protein
VLAVAASEPMDAVDLGEQGFAVQRHRGRLLI